MLTVSHSLTDAGKDARPTAVAIGNFDGVHVGHRRLFQSVVAKSREKRWCPSVLTFDPHPSKVVAPERAPKLLNTVEERWEFMEAEGIEHVIVLPFDLHFASLTPEEFARRVLVAGARAAAVFVGENFRFGARQAGDVQMLKHLGSELGFCVQVVPSVFVRGHMASSTEIRTLLAQGEVALACRLLGRPYWVQGEIATGEGVGSKLTVPTLNLDTKAEVLPADGVYITQTLDRDEARTWQSITNIGMRPTFGGNKRTIETFLLSPFDGRTPQRIRLEFLKRVREERKFDSPEKLKAQILKDVSRATAYFRRTKKYRLP